MYLSNFKSDSDVTIPFIIGMQVVKYVWTELQTYL